MKLTDNGKTGVRVTIVILIGILLVYALAIGEGLEAKRMDTWIQNKRAQEAWAAQELRRAELERADVVCRPDAC